MPKFDCNNTIDFISEYNRLCESNQDCINCPLFLVLSDNSCVRGIINRTKEAIKIVQKWSDEHPKETYVENFLKIFPKASVNPRGIPRSCRAYLYGGDDEELCEKYNNDCDSCWSAIKNK